MTDTPSNSPADTQPGSAPLPVGVRSLRDLIERVAGRGLGPLGDLGDSGVAEALPFPFLAIVGQ